MHISLVDWGWQFLQCLLIENKIKAPYNAIKWVTNKIESKRFRKENAHVDMSQEELSSRKDKESQLKSNVSKTEENIIAIHSKDPIVALEQAEKEMSKGKIISFDAQTRLKIENHIQHVKDPQTKTELQNRYTDIINNSAGKVISAVMQSNASSQNTAKDVRKHVRFSTPEKTNQVAVEPEQQLNPTSKNKSTNNK